MLNFYFSIDRIRIGDRYIPISRIYRSIGEEVLAIRVSGYSWEVEYYRAFLSALLEVNRLDLLLEFGIYNNQNIGMVPHIDGFRYEHRLGPKLSKEEVAICEAALRMFYIDREVPFTCEECVKVFTYMHPDYALKVPKDVKKYESRFLTERKDYGGKRNGTRIG